MTSAGRTKEQAKTLKLVLETKTVALITLSQRKIRNTKTKTVLELKENQNLLTHLHKTNDSAKKCNFGAIAAN